MDAEFVTVRSFVLEIVRGSIRLHSLENSIWKSLWSGEKRG